MTKLKSVLLSLALFASTVWAGPYVELGVGTKLGPVEQGYGCISDWNENLRKYDCSNNTLGIAAIGYTYKGVSIHFEHTSSFVEHDTGLNTVSLRYRYEWND